jgi:cytosine deaminase
MDIVLRSARLPGRPQEIIDIGIRSGKIVAIEPRIQAECEILDIGGRLVSPGFVETHIHLDKSCILDRCTADRGDLAEAIREVSRAKASFDAEDVYARAKRTLEKCILQGTTHIRTHVEVDPGIGLRGLEGILPLVKEYAWAVDLQICIFPQEGLLNNPGTEELMRAALRQGGAVIGACPYTDSDPAGQVERIFALSREFGCDIDMHLDFALEANNPQLMHVCDCAERYKLGGRVAVGHVTTLSAMAPEALGAAQARMRDAGVALTVLPATDLYLMGRDAERNVPRGVTPAHRLLQDGINCSLATNNVLNPFTPFGDCSLIRMANLYANVCQVGSREDMRECFRMITSRAAALMNLRGYGIELGNAADLVVLDCQTQEQAVAELAPVLHVFKNGGRTVTRNAPELHYPNASSRDR